MRILIVNDDGIHAKGIIALAERLRNKHEIFVIAPDSECSGYSHFLHFHTKVSYTEIDAIDGCNCFMLDGTPCDCVKFGLGHIMKDCLPDVVLSGVNNGVNVATDIIYSGTVNAAIEAALCGIKAIAISVRSEGNDFSYVTEFIDKNLNVLIAMPTNVVSVNFPSKCKEDIKGIKYVKAGKNAFNDEYIDMPNDGKYGKSYMLTGIEKRPHIDNLDTDINAIYSNYITITPIKAEFTDFKALEEIRECELWK